MTNNVLILSVGRRVSLAKSFQEAIADLNIDGEIFGADMNPKMSAACQVLGRHFQLPHVLDENYIDDLKKVCIDESIKLVVPTIDTELLKLAEFKNEFLAIGVTIVVSDLTLVRSCRDKRLTHELFNDIGFDIPKIYDPKSISFPCFSKPISGSLSKDVRILQSQDELDSWDVDITQMLFMEVISFTEYDEYTIDIYFDLNSQIISIVPRLRVEVRGGEISKGTTDKRIVNLVKAQMSQLRNAFGCLTLQIFKAKESNKVYGIEINPRFGGGFPLSNASGAKYPEYLLREVILGEKLSYHESWEDGLTMLRYDAEVLTRNG